MVRIGLFFLIVLALPSLACGLASQPVPATPSSQENQVLSATVLPQEVATVVPTSTETPQPTPTETSSPSETETAPAATIPPFLTSIPGIVATLTAGASTPGAEETRVAQQTMLAATEAVQLKEFGSSLLTPCQNLSDPPMQNWVDIPVMPQATAGQVVQTLIGSYYCFRAPVTVEEMESFYKEKLTPPEWVLQADANGSMNFIGLSRSGVQLLFLLSGPGNKNDLIVAINETSPVGIPTPKP
ncbi:MAG: hypothetical protein ABSB41_00855 [Anaerolineales bacterium]